MDDDFRRTKKRGRGKNFNGEGSRARSGSRRQHPHPAHLRGREIGLFYAKRNKANGVPKVYKPIASIQIPQEKIDLITKQMNESADTSDELLKGNENSSKFKQMFLNNVTGSIQDKMNCAHFKFSQDKTLDQKYYEEIFGKQTAPKYRDMLERRKRLPSYVMKDEIVKLIEENQVAVISGDTGCGKTTQVAQFVLDDYMWKKKGSVCKIVCTQPRRISAISVAERVADERNEALGRSVGYQIRLEGKKPRNSASIVFCTTGTVLKWMEDDPCLSDVSHLILDEIHERDASFDFLMALLKQVLTKRKDLKVVLMSATLNSETFSKYFGQCMMNCAHYKFSPDKTLDQRYYEEIFGKRRAQKYRDMLERRKRLPSYEMKDQIVKIIEENQVAVISGDTGCGKTTQVAQFVLDDYMWKKKGSVCKIVCTQPRRISAISVAERVADERNEALWRSVGYQIRLDGKKPRDSASIVFCTTGIVLKWMEDDPCLSDVSHLILDEIHERDVSSDFLMALLKQVLTKRKDLKVILMSATLNSETFSKYFGQCIMCKIPGLTFPVKQYYLEDVLEKTQFQYNSGFSKYPPKTTWDIPEYTGYIEPHIRQLEREGKYSRNTCIQLRNPASENVNIDLILQLLIYICNNDKTNAAVLIFLTGYVEITNLNNAIEKSGKFPMYKNLVIPLHSRMPTTDQKQVFERPPSGRRKIIIATNIAETSITIDDVVYVIDCGKIKIKNFDAETNSETLRAEWVSQANALQRKGRAGRVQEGVCYHLFSEVRYKMLDAYLKPEILRCRLDNVILQLKILQLGNAEQFLSSLIDVPDTFLIKLSIDLLHRLNALDPDENLTPLGYHLARLPVAPQMGKMMLMGVIFGCLDPILSIAASLDFKDAFQTPLGKEKLVDMAKMELSRGEKSDHLVLYEALRMFDTTHDRRNFCWDHFLSHSTLQLLQNMKRQFAEYLYEMKFVPNVDPKNRVCNANSDNMSLVKAILCAGLFPNVVRVKRAGKTRYTFSLMENQSPVRLHPKSVLNSVKCYESPLLVYYLRLKSSADFIHDATMVNPLPLVFFCDKLEYDEEAQILKLSDSVKFACKKEVSDLITKLRHQLNLFLEFKAENLGVVDWSSYATESRFLWPILELITAEDLGEMYD